MARSSGPSSAVVDAVLERDHWSCVVCDEAICGDRGKHWSIQHRIPRQMGGSANDPRINLTSNLFTVCGSGTTGCHGAIEGPLRSIAYDNGWLVKRSHDPRRIPVLIERGRRKVFLTNDARRLQDLEEVA